MQSLEKELIKRLAGGRSRTDVELVCETGSSYPELELAVDRLLADGRIVIISSADAPETEYRLS